MVDTHLVVTAVSGPRTAPNTLMLSNVWGGRREVDSAPHAVCRDDIIAAFQKPPLSVVCLLFRV